MNFSDFYLTGLGYYVGVLSAKDCDSFPLGSGSDEDVAALAWALATYVDFFFCKLNLLNSSKGFAPLSLRSFMIYYLLCLLAIWSGAYCFLSSWFTFAPFLINRSTVSNFPPFTA